ncbi:MAG: tripartite tricarboxylate transporter TctB family protein [Desulfobacteraceae bacterium]|nr:MAG: tripartite tricarboxylate transporter TctB family protein [Desulfobacteraceae bacterium]
MRNRLSGLFWLGFSAFICFESLKAEIGTFGRPGAGFLPFWSSLILGILAAILVIKSIAVGSAGPDIIQVSGKGKRSRVIFTLAILLVYTLCLERAGYLASTFVLMIFLYKIAGRRLWMQILRAVVTVLATYVIFHVWLGVQLPSGILSF